MVKIVAQPFDGILVLEPDRFMDLRGFFVESYNREEYQTLGIRETFVQDNHSRSVKNVLRGLHFARNVLQSQLMTVIHGKVFDVVVDLRKDSPTFGKWSGIELSDEAPRQIYMAHGFAHGFCVLSDFADLHYKVSQLYDPNNEGGLIWNDAEVKIRWPITDPIISDRDLRHPSLKDL
jgi:dTDP-4-dehydrorhamnose 3,5-epimerase